LDNIEQDGLHVPKIGNRSLNKNNLTGKSSNQKINEDIINVLSGVNDPKI
jgi:hypothetical protein